MISNTNMLPNKATSLLIIDELLFTSVGLGVIVGETDGRALKVGAGDIVGANENGDDKQSGLVSLLSKHSHCGVDRVKSHLPRPEQLAGHIILRRGSSRRRWAAHCECS